jgi:hypothetical protein
MGTTLMLTSRNLEHQRRMLEHLSRMANARAPAKPASDASQLSIRLIGEVRRDNEAKPPRRRSRPIIGENEQPPLQGI